MAIYGAGKAFNLEFIQRGQVSKNPHVLVKSPQPQIFHGGSVTKTTNITVNNGPTGFWGFMGGLFNGLLGGFGGFGSFNSFGMGMGMGMGMPMMTSPFGMLNQAQMQPQQAKTGDRLNDLKTLYPDWNIVSDGNGNYDATSKDGTVHHKGNFEQMCELLKKEKETQGKPETTEDKTLKKAELNPTPENNTPNKSQTPEQVSENGSGWQKASADDLKNYKGNISVNDFADGGGASINGTTTLSEPAGYTEGFPEFISVKGYKYKFQTVDTDGKAIYKSLNGKGDTYKLEKQGNSFGLNQHEGDNLDGVGSIDIGGNKSSGSVGQSQGAGNASGSRTVNDNITVKRNNDGSVAVTIGVPYKNTGTVTISADEATGLTDQELKALAKSKLQKQSTLFQPKFTIME